MTKNMQGAGAAPTGGAIPRPVASPMRPLPNVPMEGNVMATRPNGGLAGVRPMGGGQIGGGGIGQLYHSAGRFPMMGNQ